MVPYSVRALDGTPLTVHRLVHPSDAASRGPLPGRKKPYLFVHGLFGSSAGFITPIDDDYVPDAQAVNIRNRIDKHLERLAQRFEYDWKSTADLHRNILDIKSSSGQAPLARKSEPDYNGDPSPFGRAFSQGYRKFQLDRDDLRHVTSSLAATMANFANDVWLVNVRGNSYSPTDKWNFKLDTIVEQDLPEVIRFVQREARWSEPIGLITYSYGSMYALRLLASLPRVGQALEPIVMMAPTLLSAKDSGGLGFSKRALARIGSRALMSGNGPFPSSAHNRGLESVICQLPVASKVCRLPEQLVTGGVTRAASINDLVIKDRKATLSQQDMDCGRTSKALLQQVITNFVDKKPLHYFKPAVQSIRGGRREPRRRSVILVHSDSDEMASPAEVGAIRDNLLKTMTLMDYAVSAPNFQHADFLFSRRNRVLVNAEVVRMTQIYDNLMYNRNANAPTEPLRVH